MKGRFIQYVKYAYEEVKKKDGTIDKKIILDQSTKWLVPRKATKIVF
jgi:hypothetical protein